MNNMIFQGLLVAHMLYFVIPHIFFGFMIVDFMQKIYLYLYRKDSFTFQIITGDSLLVIDLLFHQLCQMKEMEFKKLFDTQNIAALLPFVLRGIRFSVFSFLTARCQLLKCTQHLPYEKRSVSIPFEHAYQDQALDWIRIRTCQLELEKVYEPNQTHEPSRIDIVGQIHKPAATNVVGSPKPTSTPEPASTEPLGRRKD